MCHYLFTLDLLSMFPREEVMLMICKLIILLGWIFSINWLIPFINQSGWFDHRAGIHHITFAQISYSLDKLTLAAKSETDLSWQISLRTDGHRLPSDFYPIQSEDIKHLIFWDDFRTHCSHLSFLIAMRSKFLLEFVVLRTIWKSGSIWLSSVWCPCFLCNHLQSQCFKSVQIWKAILCIRAFSLNDQGGVFQKHCKPKYIVDPLPPMELQWT